MSRTAAHSLHTSPASCGVDLCEFAIKLRPQFAMVDEPGQQILCTMTQLEQ